MQGETSNERGLSGSAAGSGTDDFLIQPPAVSLPQGGGAIGGMGEKFQVNAATGTAGLSLPLPLSPARMTPSVGLNYDSGAGNGPFGLGWQLSVPSIQRKTARGLPTYRDARDEDPDNDRDTFVLSGLEELVPRLRSDGSWALRTATEASGTYTVRAYRPRTEGGFARIERWTDTATGDTHWRTQSRTNSWRIYGQSTGARVADPNDASRVFEWKIEKEWDERGNHVRYEWVTEDRGGVTKTLAEAARARPGQAPTFVYLKKVHYANTQPDPDDPGPPANTWLFSVVFDYGEHSASDPEFEPAAPPAWPVRQDPYSTYRAGFEQRCYRLCRRVLIFHNVDELKANTSDPPVLVRSLELTYEEDPRVTLLTGAATKGWMPDGSGGWTTELTPSLVLDYTRPTLGTTLESVSGLDDLPASFETGRFQLVDLDGEGLSGLLCEQGGAWFYKRNEGGGRFGRFARLGSRPSLDLGRPDVRLVDIQGDGQLDLVQQGRGFSARNEQGGWNPLKPFHEVPNLNWNDPNLRLLDLDGDGHADLLLTNSRALWWYPGKAEEGFGPARKVWRPDNENEGPVLLFGSESESIFLADMSGDGLTDIVQVRNGSIAYWPNLGYGRFGGKVRLAGAPRFDTRERFDPRRVRLVDLDGSGPTDLMYLGPDKVRVWFNQSGNAWSDEGVLSRIPGVSDAATVQVSDLLGDGTACVVWSTRSPRAATRGLKYFRVMADGKPWLLTRIVNNRGRTTSLEYTPSTSFYTQARQAGTPWATRLPFPVQCLSKVTTEDGVTGWRFTQAYAYHHGYFDGHEREFRGFGRVDTWDTEVVPDPADFNNDSQLEYPQPPVYTRTWFHTGAWKKALDLEAAYASEYWSGDSSAQWLERDVLPTGLSPEALREAHRALRGQTLRTEVYALDGSASEGLPYTVSMSRVEVRQLQESFGQDRPGVWLTVPLESISRHYERDATDPRTTHELTLYADAYGTVLRSASVAYPRRDVTGRLSEQDVLHTVVTERAVIHHDDGDYYADPQPNPAPAPELHLGLPDWTQTWELRGSSYSFHDGALVTPEGLDDDFTDVGTTALDFEDTFAGSGIEKRLLGHTRTKYWNDGLTAALSEGSAGSRALVYQRYRLAMTDGLMDAVYDLGGGNVVTGTLLTEAGYIDLDSDGTAWMQSGIQTHDSNHFYLPTDITDPWGNPTTVTYDSYFLVVKEVEDALENTTTAVLDYRVLAPKKVTDPNGCGQEAAFDALGRVTKMSVFGASSEGDSLSDPTVKYSYNTTQWTSAQKPNWAKVETREVHGSGNNRWMTAIAYSDGGGGVVQTKTQVPAGLAPKRDGNGDLVFSGGELVWEDTSTYTAPADVRWVGSGRTVVDNKGNPIKQYEPFFAATSLYEDEDDIVAWGVTPILTYDPLGRLIRTDLPDGHFRSVAFTPWTSSTFDEADNKTGGAHENTPALAHFDVLGRVVRQVVTPDGSTDYETVLTLDIQGNPTTLTDPRGNDIQLQTFDLLGRPLRTFSTDEGYDGTSAPTKGNTRMLLGADNQPVRTWKSGSLTLRQTYDALRRPVGLFVDEGSGERLVTLTFYGDSLSDTPASSYAQTRPLHVYDTAGRLTFQYDFQGRVIEQSRQVFTDITATPDWSGLENETALVGPAPAVGVTSWVSTNGGLESETFTITSDFNAWGQPVTQTTPDDSDVKYGYNIAGQLLTVDVDIRAAGSDTAFVEDITYNARGQREVITYGNHTQTTYTYDLDRFWLTRLLTQRDSGGTGGAATLQDLKTTRDAVGNITAIEDDAQTTLFFDNAQVTPDRTFSYDALYRLIAATGREKDNQTQTSAFYSDYAGAMGGVPDPTTVALRQYTQSYTYDGAGNITEMKHQQGLGGTVLWKRGYDYEGGNNQLVATSLPTDTYGTPSTYSDAYAYNDRGAMVALPHLRSGVNNIVRDFRDQIRQALLPTTNHEAWYAYDAGGQRVRKFWDKNGTTEERITIGPFEVWRQRNGSGVQEERETLHILDDTQRVCMIETLTITGGSAVGSPVPRKRYQLTDHLGTALLEVDDLGAVITYEEYHPYGTTAWWAEDSAIQVSRKRYRYTGKEKDEETGLYYHGHRYYMPWLGRWERADPIGLGDGGNRFVYVGGNPVGRRDPMGTQSEEDLTIYFDEQGQQVNLPEIVVEGKRESGWAKAGAALAGLALGIGTAVAAGFAIGAAIGAGIVSAPVVAAVGAVGLVALAVDVGIHHEEYAASARRLATGEASASEYFKAGFLGGTLVGGPTARGAVRAGVEAGAEARVAYEIATAEMAAGPTAEVLETELAALESAAVVGEVEVTGGGVASKGAIGFAKGTADTALTGMRGGGGHAIRKLQGDLIPDTGSLASRVDAFKDIATPILENPSISARWRVGATKGQAFVGAVADGRQLAVVVASEGAHQGKVISAFFPDANQLALMRSR